MRIGHLVRRPTNFWSESVHDLLRYLEAVGFPAPRLVEVGGDFELLEWIDGESGPDGWSKIVPEAGLRIWALFLRRYHDAVSSYSPPPGSHWSSGPRACGAGEIVCHGDYGPWNGVWRGDEVVGLLDFDHARPAPALFDIAYALEYAAPFRDDSECVNNLGYLAPPDRRRRIEVFCEAYGIAVPDDVVAQVVGQQRLVNELCESLGRRGIEPQATWIEQGHLDELRARVKWTESLEL